MRFVDSTARHLDMVYYWEKLPKKRPNTRKNTYVYPCKIRHDPWHSPVPSTYKISPLPGWDFINKINSINGRLMYTGGYDWKYRWKYYKCSPTFAQTLQSNYGYRLKSPPNHLQIMINFKLNYIICKIGRLMQRIVKWNERLHRFEVEFSLTSKRD